MSVAIGMATDTGRTAPRVPRYAAVFVVRDRLPVFVTVNAGDDLIIRGRLMAFGTIQ